VTGEVHAPAALSPEKNPDMDTEIYRRSEKIAFLIRGLAGTIAFNTFTEHICKKYSTANLKMVP
jgi:hypothetical protein